MRLSSDTKMSNSDDDFLPNIGYTPISTKDKNVKPKFVPPASNKFKPPVSNKLKTPVSNKTKHTVPKIPKPSSSTPSFFQIPENEFLKEKVNTTVLYRTLLYYTVMYCTVSNFIISFQLITGPVQTGVNHLERKEKSEQSVSNTKQLSSQTIKSLHKQYPGSSIPLKLPSTLKPEPLPSQKPKRPSSQNPKNSSSLNPKHFTTQNRRSQSSKNPKYLPLQIKEYRENKQLKVVNLKPHEDSSSPEPMKALEVQLDKVKEEIGRKYSGLRVDEEMEKGAKLISLLTSISSLLEEESSSPSMLVSGLVKLATIPVTVPALLSTGMGKVVRRLQDREGEVGRLAGKLVNRWKRIALQYEPQHSTDGETVSDEMTEEPVAVLVQPSTGDGEPMSEEVAEEPVAIPVQSDKQLREVMNSEWEVENRKLQYKKKCENPKKKPQRNVRTVTTYFEDEEFELDDSFNDSDYKIDEEEEEDVSSSSEEDSDEKENEKLQILSTFTSSHPLDLCAMKVGKTRLPPTSTVSRPSVLPSRSPKFHESIDLGGARSTLIRTDISLARNVSEIDIKTATGHSELVKDALSDTGAPGELNEQEFEDTWEVREVAINIESGNIPVRESAVFSCKLCKKKFISLKCFLNHQFKCGKICYACNICQKMFKCVRYLKMHVKKVHREPMHSCELCELQFQTPAKLKTHIKTHAVAKCITCGKLFKNVASLRAHKNKVHIKLDSRKGQIWSCTFCTKKLTSERGMRYHITLHKTILDDVVSEVGENTFGEEDSVRTNIEEVDLANLVVDTVSDNIIVLQ